MRETYVAEFIWHLEAMNLRTSLLDASVAEGVHIWLQGHHVEDPDVVVWLHPDGLAVWGRDRECSAKGLTPLELAYAVLESVGGHGQHCGP